MREYKKIFIALAIMALLSPLGIFLPEIFKAGSAWGEWSSEEVKEMVGYEPTKMSVNAERWKAPIPDYAFPASEGSSLARQSVDYIISAYLGIIICAGIGYLSARSLVRRKK